MEQKTTGAYNLIAAYPDMTSAERAIERLKDAGIRGEQVSLLRRNADHVVITDEGKTDDRETIADAVRGTVAGTVGGGILGGLAGFLIGLAAFAIPGVGPVIGAGVWASTALGVIGGGSAGSLVGAITGAALSNEKDETYRTHLELGHVLVGIQSDDPTEFERAFETVVVSQPLSVDRYGAGTPARA
jgi:uncharacterized membrane protein